MGALSLTANDAATIVALRDHGVSRTAIAARTGKTRGAIDHCLSKVPMTCRRCHRKLGTLELRVQPNRILGAEDFCAYCGVATTERGAVAAPPDGWVEAARLDARAPARPSRIPSE